MNRNAPTLTQPQLDELRQELEREIKRLERAMRGTKQDSQPVQLDQGAVGRVSRIDAIQNQQMSASAYGRDQVRYGVDQCAPTHGEGRLRPLRAMWQADSIRAAARAAGVGKLRGVRGG